VRSAVQPRRRSSDPLEHPSGNAREGRILFRCGHNVPANRAGQDCGEWAATALPLDKVAADLVEEGECLAAGDS